MMILAMLGHYMYHHKLPKLIIKAQPVRDVFNLGTSQTMTYCDK